MSWSDETRCLHCDGKLPLYRKLTNGQFCSASHRKAYWQEQERLAVERLHQTHDSLRAYRPAGALEAIFGINSETNPYYTDTDGGEIAPAAELIAKPSLAAPLTSKALSPEAAILQAAIPPAAISQPVPQPVYQSVPQPTYQPAPQASSKKTSASKASKRAAAQPVALPKTPADEIARRASNAGQVAQPGFMPLAFPVACAWQDFTALSKPAKAEWALLAPHMPSLERPTFGLGISMAGPVQHGEIAIAANPATTAALKSAIEPAAAQQVNAPLTQLQLSAAPVSPELEILAQASAHAFTAADEEPVTINIPAEEPAPLVVLSEPVVAVPEMAPVVMEPEPVQAAAPEIATVVEETYPEMGGMLALPRISASHTDLVQSSPDASIDPIATTVPMLFARMEAAAVEAAVSQPATAWEAKAASITQMLALPQILGQNFVSVTRSGAAEPILRNAQPSFADCETTGLQTDFDATGFRTPVVAGLVGLPVGSVRDTLKKSSVNAPDVQPAVAPPSAGKPSVAISTDAIPTCWSLAGGIRYPVNMRDCELSIAKESVAPAFNDSLTIELPCEVGTLVVEPSAAWLLPVPFEHGGPRVAPEPELRHRNVILMDANGQEPSIPASRLTPIQGTLEPQSRFGLFTAAARNAAGALEPKFAWTYAVDFWQHAPRDLKLLVFAIPALLALALHPSLPKFRVTPNAHATVARASGASDSASSQLSNTPESEVVAPPPSRLQAAVKEHFVNVRQTVSERAGVELTEDFRAGLDAWQSRGDLSAAWSFDSNGFVRPGMLALYQPSMNLKDYDMNFLGLIDKKALSFVVRAQDFDNYYVIKLVIVKPGPLPTLGITRYAVIDGKPQERRDVVAPINARPDMLYRVSLNIHDDTFLLEMQGQIVDSWTEAKLTHGGVGFFTAHGEESRLRWVQVTHQYDMLGRLCAYLAPYNMPITNGSW